MADRIASLDLLRGVAAFSVAIPHFLMSIGAGGMGSELAAVVAVEIFFVLSGYVLAPQIIGIIDKSLSYRTFLIRRWYRTVPAYLVALLLTAAATGWSIPTEDFLRNMFYVQNLWAQHNKIDFYSIGWSLSIEEWFYVVFPLFMLACVKYFKAPLSGYAIAALLFVLLVSGARIVFGHGDDWGASVRRVVVFRVDAIAWGFLLYLARDQIRLRLAFLLTGFLAAGVATSMSLVLGAEHAFAQAAYPFLAAVFGGLSILVFLSAERLLAGARMQRFASWCGRVSYSVYLFHLICIFVVSTTMADLSSWNQLMAFVLLTAVTATVTTHFIEAPFLRWRPSYGTRRAFAVTPPQAS